MFVDSGRITAAQGKKQPVITTTEELKKHTVKEEQKELIAQGWERNQEHSPKKRARAANP